MAPLGVHVSERCVTGTLRDVLLQLLPLTGPRRRRYVFIPTESPWVSFFDNGPQGTDATSVCMHLARVMSCRALRLTAVPHTLTAKGQMKGRYGACTLELFGPHGDPLGYERVVSVVCDGGSWAFDRSGEPLPFERVEQYHRKKISERFTIDDLRDYAAAMGLRPFDEDFYCPESARLVELTGAKPRGMTESSLEQARASF